MSADPLRTLTENARAWPFEEARKLVERTKGMVPNKGHVLLETGYGPSGLPHIGTFGEVARTTMVRRAFETLTGIPTKLVAFSDDMDGLRKVPGNVPNPKMLAEHLGKPLMFVVNGAAARARITEEAIGVLSQHGHLAPTVLHQRVDFASSMIDGRTVMELPGRSRSKDEIEALWRNIDGRLFGTVERRVLPLPSLTAQVA